MYLCSFTRSTTGLRSAVVLEKANHFMKMSVTSLMSSTMTIRITRKTTSIGSGVLAVLAPREPPSRSSPLTVSCSPFCWYIASDGRTDSKQVSFNIFQRDILSC